VQRSRISVARDKEAFAARSRRRPSFLMPRRSATRLSTSSTSSPSRTTPASRCRREPAWRRTWSGCRSVSRRWATSSRISTRPCTPPRKC